MEKESARNQTLEQLHERRKQVIRLHKRGIKVMELVQMSGLSYPTVRKTLDLFKQGGWAAIKPAGRGRTKGDARLLTPEQEAH
jgi:transposase